MPAGRGLGGPADRDHGHQADDRARDDEERGASTLPVTSMSQTARNGAVPPAITTPMFQPVATPMYRVWVSNSCGSRVYAPTWVATVLSMRTTYAIAAIVSPASITAIVGNASTM